MADILVTSPFQPFTLPTQFKAVFNGYVYCGTVDAVDPSVSQVQVYLINESGDKVPVAQPIRTNAGGYLVYNGQPAKFVTDANHSLLVQDQNLVQVWYAPDMANIDPAAVIDVVLDMLGDPSGAALIGFIQAGTGAVPRTAQDKMRERVTPEDFGAVGDGVADDTVAIQNAVNIGRVVNCASKTYKIAGTVILPSNSWICGAPGTEFLGVMTPEGGGAGGYPNQMFKNANATGDRNILFTNIKFNFGKGSFNYVSGPTLTTINGLFFKGVEELVFEDCTFFDFVTNLNTTLTGKDLLRFGMAQFDNCARVRFNRILSENLREEGFNFYECQLVSFTNWRGRGEVIGTSSHAGIWYCDGVRIQDAYFTHTGGSVINCCSRNVYFENINVNDNPGVPQDGRGFDFGNELDARSFEQGNINVVGCSLRVLSYGIYITPSVAFPEIVESINILNNRIYVAQETPGGSCWGVRSNPAKALNIQNNFIYLSDVDAEGVGHCVILSVQDTTKDVDFFSNTTIYGNNMRGLAGITCQCNIDSSIDGLYIDKNTFISQDKGAFSSSAGASVFVYVRNNSSAVSDFDLSNVYVRDNTATNIGGGLFVTVLDAPAQAKLSNINIERNRVTSGAAQMDRTLTIDGSGGGTADVRVSNNIFEGSSTQNYTGLKYLFIDRNLWRWGTENTLRRINVNNHNGIFEMTNNRMTNTTQTQADLVQTGSTFSILAVTGNSSSNAAGTLAFSKATLPANTTLPN